MNAIGMMLQPSLQTKETKMQAIDLPSENDASSFQCLLRTAQKNNQTERQQLLASNSDQSLRNDGELKASEARDALQQLRQFITQFVHQGGDGASKQAETVSEEEIKQLFAENHHGVMLTDKLKELKESTRLADIPEKLQGTIDKLLTKSDGKTDKPEGQTMPLQMVMPQQPQPFSDKQTVQQQFKSLFAAAETQLNQITDQKRLFKAAPELLQLLKEWTALTDKTDQSHEKGLKTESSHDNRNAKIWRDLVQSFQKRNQFTMKQQYQSNTKITNHDVAKWLQHAMQTQDKTTGKQTVAMTSSLPMSKVEQFVIYLNQARTNQPAGQQLLDQFQKVLKTSTFLHGSNGASQINISLRPENLGDMQVKLTQLNGEMTVKIAVSTAAAKDMLESNMHQLKSMFSPQQVTIEKHDPAVQETPSSQQDEHGQPMDSDEQEQSEHSGQDDQEDEDESFDDALETMLTSTEVAYDIH